MKSVWPHTVCLSSCKPLPVGGAKTSQNTEHHTGANTAMFNVLTGAGDLTCEKT